MPGALIKDFSREIRKSLGRFLSIFTIVLIGVSFFAGVKASAPDMEYTADKYFDDYNMMDIQVMSTLGLTEDDIDEIKKIDNVDKVQAGYFTDAVSMINSTEFVFRVHSLPEETKTNANADYVNEIKLTEGRYPRSSGECILEESLTIDLGLEIGDTVTLSSGTAENITDEVLNTNKFTIVGKAVSPYYLSYEKGSSDVGSGKVNFFLMIPEEDFKYPVYTEALILVKDAKAMDAYGTEYEKAIEKVASSLENLGVDRSDIRLAEVKEQATKALEEARQKYQTEKDAYDSKIAEAEKKLDDALAEIVEGETSLEVEKKYYAQQTAEAEQDIKDAEQQIADGEVALEAAQAEYDAAMAEYGDDLDNLDSTMASINSSIADAKKQIADLEAQLEDPSLTEEERQKRLQLIESYKGLITSLEDQLESANALNSYAQKQRATAEKELASARKQLDDAKAQLAQGKKDLAKSKADAAVAFRNGDNKIAAGKRRYEAANKEYEESKLSGSMQLEEAKEKLIRAENEIDRISSPKWYVLDRNSNYGFVDYKLTADRIDSIANVFPVFFFLVAALVCLTTMTRMVDEQRGIIGTYKALGYSSNSIASKYILYAAIASVLGGVAGVFIGTNIFPQVIFRSYSMMYSMPSLSPVNQPMLMTVSVIMGVLVTTLAAYSACSRDMREMPAALLRPKAPKAGKEILLEKIGFIWRRLSFSHKVTARNLFRYKKRFFMTVIGISGCTALLLAGFGLNNSISQVVNKQYIELFNYNLNIRFTGDASIENKKNISDELEAEGSVNSLIEASEFNAEVNSGGENIAVTLIVPEDTEAFTDYILLRDRVSQKSFDLPESGIVITEKLAKELNVEVGSSIELDNGDGAVKKVEVAAITENYVFHYAYMSPTYYKEIFRLMKSPNSLMVKLNNSSTELESQISSQLIKKDSVASVTYYSAAAESFSEKITSLNSIVYVIIASAGLLAFVVMYNLTNINIGERIREIATIKVLGFYNREVSSYVYRENILLSLIGGVFGLVLGIFLHRFIMVSIEQDGIMFGNYIEPISFLYSFIITFFFSLLVNLAMYPRLKNIPMVESLKSIE